MFLNNFFKEQWIRPSNRIVFLAIFFFGTLPHLAFAQIIISEFLYDAEGSDSDKEFVELFNAGTSAVDLTGWKINDGSNHTLNVPPKNGGTGSISIAPGAYVLLVDDATAFIPLHSGVSASILDTVLSLPNTGGAISLLNEDGTTIDSVSYTKDAGGAGDGNSLARTSVSSASVTSISPTPGVGSLTQSSGNSDSSDTSGSTGNTTATTSQNQTTQTSNTAKSSASFAPETQLFADAGGDRVVIVGADTEFVGQAYNRKKENVSSARLVWNFGDGSTMEGTHILHHFNYPGRYVVYLDIAESENAASDQITVTAEKADLRFSALPDGSVSIENHSGRTLDLSQWIIRDQNRSFILPDHSLVLADAAMFIAGKTLGFNSSATTEFVYPNGEVMLHAGASTVGTRAAEPSSQVISQPQTPAVSTAAAKPAPTRKSTPAKEVAEESDQVLEPQEQPVSEIEEASSSSQVAAAVSANPAFSKWWVGVGGLSVLAAGALIIAQRYSKKEWDITEEK